MASPAVMESGRSSPTMHGDSHNHVDAQAAKAQPHNLGMTSDGKDATLHPDHPINAFGRWKKMGILAALGWSGFVANYSAAAHLTAFEPMAEYFEVTVPDIANAIGYSLLGIAVGPLFWNPLSKTIGRRPTYLLGSFLFLPCVIWMALSKTYVSFAVARVFAGLTSSFSQTVPPSSIADCFRKEVRGDKMSIFGVCVIIAPALAPLFGGLLVHRYTWQSIYWLVLGFGGLQFLLFFFLVPETMWVEDGAENDGRIQMNEHEVSQSVTPPVADDTQKVSGAEQRLEEGPSEVVIRGGRRGAAWMPWQRPAEFGRIFMSPIYMARYITITVPSFYYGMLFCFSVSITIVLPQILGPPPYSFSTIASGASYLAFGIGSVLGKWSGGIVGDKIVQRLERKHGHRQPEYRLYALLPVLPFMFIGLFIFGITVDRRLAWIAPLIGGAVFYYCLVTATGVLQTYVLEGFIERSMDTQANFVFWKCIWGFTAGFFAYQWGELTGFTAEYAAQGALSLALGGALCAVLISKGKEIRSWQNMPVRL